ncbi:hypothetical protein BK004_03660 [bacterium CG10_46_32]|uniref:Glycosyl hydrolase n=1 Tax=Candidatus Campbellbacteria bacterium CG22_combo_CG10-13_8_21_14_all_43_18 TaxID=1974530 RepID=A0A2H0DVV2_9BACT|nr:MAG: hypothetical protein BK004_03660 [bacterium CG10_46_32]PIP86303.1 MAG: glycosyl hydrolase [Candidatus Campbellbacteria bacterium CG22_combo_CG10-13_8_21_14_all_43_18]PIR55895.1 MAG: glycosyl hydrolase [Parcubacteria group bacterium CG10_big_fil_rev_8_21_14_0_10_46_32]
MDLKTLKDKLKEIKKMGFVKTHRSGNTGIGKTLEDLLEIKENNIPLPDIGEVAELKSYRKSSLSMMSLFTLEPLPKGGDRDRMLLDGFGYSKRNNNRSKELHSTLSSKKFNAQNLKVKVEKDKIRIIGKGRKLNIYWDMPSLEEKFNKKLPALVYVLGDTKIIKEKEYFHFVEGYFLDGFSFEAFKKRMKNDDIVPEFRMYYRPDGSIRNHGTAFRIKMKKLDDCFAKKVRLI